jgi:hypothetical protein
MFENLSWCMNNIDAYTLQNKEISTLNKDYERTLKELSTCKQQLTAVQAKGTALQGTLRIRFDVLVDTV